MANDPLTIRPATSTDRAAVARIADPVQDDHARALPARFRPAVSPLPMEHFHQLLTSRISGILVAEAGGDIVGFVVLRVTDASPIPVYQPRRVTFIDMIAVDQTCRGQGIGKALMGAAMEWGRERSADELELSVHEFNQTAIAFYERFGLRTVIRRMSVPLHLAD